MQMTLPCRAGLSLLYVLYGPWTVQTVNQKCPEGWSARVNVLKLVHSMLVLGTGVIGIQATYSKVTASNSALWQNVLQRPCLEAALKYTSEYMQHGY